VPPVAGRNAAPKTFTVDGGAWPDADVHADAPPHVRYALVFARAVEAERAGRGGLSVRALARALGVPHNTLGRALAGDVVPDLVTVAAVEAALGRRLLPAPARRPADGQ